jgi:hypothetical protein
MRGMSMNFPPSVNKKNIKTLGSSMMSLFEWTQRTCDLKAKKLIKGR